MSKTIMTKQLQLIPHITGTGFFGGWDSCDSWGNLDSLIKFCTNNRGSLIERDECDYLPVDIARRQYKNHHEKQTEYANEEAETMRKEMTYHLYLLNTPDMHTPCHKLYFYIKDSFTKNQDTDNKIMQFYYQLIIDTNIHKAVALQIKSDYEKCIKKNTLHSSIEYYRFGKREKEQHREDIKKQLGSVEFLKR